MGQIEDLRLFTLIVENGSISKAAKKLSIAKSAASRRLNLLEDRFDSKLIDRSPGNWEVTSAGHELFHRSVRIVGEVDEIESDFTSNSQHVTGPLAISIPREYGMAQMSGKLVSFLQLYPDVVLTADFDDRIVDLERENYDFVIRITPKVVDKISHVQIGTSRHGLYASKQYLDKCGEPEDPNELKRHRLLHYGNSKRATWVFRSPEQKQHSIVFQPYLNSNNGSFLLDATKQSLGIARLPDFVVADALEAGLVIPVLSKFEIPVWGVYLAHAQNRRLNRRMRLFSEHLENEI